MKLTPIKTKVKSIQEDIETNRNQFIGGSDAGAVLGMNQYKSCYALWLEKTGRMDSEVDDNDAMRIGRDLEDYVAKRFCEMTGKKVKRDPYRYSLKEYPYIVGHIDRRVVGENAFLECKTANSYQNSKYSQDIIPDHYYAQLTHYMAVTGFEKGYIAVLAFPHIYWWEIMRNEGDVEALVSVEEEFWGNVQSDTPPALDGSESTSEAIAKVYTAQDFKETGTDIVPLTNEYFNPATYFELKQQIEEMKEIVTAQENQVKALMENHERAMVDDCMITWTSYEQRRVDSARLKKDHPDIYEQYSKVSKGRRFSVKKIKAKEIEN